MASAEQRQPPNISLRTLIVAAAYLTGGVLSIATGLIAKGPSGQTAVVWLPPGIALAALLVWGKRVWPGVFVGAFVLDAVMSYYEAPKAGLPIHLVLALPICIASTLQAVVTCMLVQRFSGRALALDRPRSVFGFMLGSALASPITSGVGSLSLIAAGVRRAQDLPLDWSSWWISDTMSVFLVTPVLLAWIAQPADFWRPRRMQLTLPLCMALVLVATAFVQANRVDADRAHQDFELRVDQTAAVFADELDDIMDSAHVLKDVQDSSAKLNPEQFRLLASRIRQRNSGIAVVAWVPRVTAEQRERHELLARTSDEPDYAIRELDADRRAVVASARPDYFPIRLVEPDHAAFGVLGLDLGSLPSRRKLLEQSSHSRALTMSEPLELIGFASNRLGVLVVLPVYHEGPGIEGAAALRGFVVCVLRIQSLMAGVVDAATARDLDLRLRDEAAPAPRRLLFASTRNHVSKERLTYSARRDFRAGERVWRLDAQPTAAYLHAHHSWLAPAVSVIGLAFSALLCGLLLVTTGQAASTQQLVNDRTEELSQANAKLRDEVVAHERMEQALKESEARWHFALEEAGDGVWDWNIPEDQLFWSPRLFEILGYDPGDLSSTIEKWASTTHPEDLPTVRRLLKRHLSGQTPLFTTELRMRRKDGSWIWFFSRAKVVARDADGKPLRVIGTQTDVTARIRVEQELKNHREHLEVLVTKRTAELEVAKGVAEQANRAKSAFLANMSHELRTPMHAVLAYARLGLDKNPGPKLADFLSRIVDSGERLLWLLNDLLDLSKLEAGKMLVDLGPQDLKKIVRQVALEIEPLLAHKHIVLDIARSPGCDNCEAVVDGKRMAQVFHNVLSNAVRFSSDGGRITIRFALAELPGDSARDIGRARPALEVAFSDEGVGIPEDELELIFDKFVQSSKTRTNAGGTGLGLAICKQIAELHGGSIRARNNPGPGATFLVTVPLQARAALGAGEAA